MPTPAPKKLFGGRTLCAAHYHHFANKQALFVAVLEDVQDEVSQRVAAAAAAESDPWQQLVVGCRAFLAASVDPQVQQIMLTDGASVVGWVQWREMDAERSMKLLRRWKDYRRRA